MGVLKWLADSANALSKEMQDLQSVTGSASQGFRALIIDFETSGLEPARGARAVWVGSATWHAGRIERGFSVAVAGTDGLGYYGDPPADVERKPHPTVIDMLLEAMQSAEVVVAHNASFDAKFALAESAQAGRTLSDTPWLCTMILAQKVLPDLPNYQLETCLAHYGIDPGTPHSALDDAFATAQLFNALIEDARSQGDTSLQQLLRIARMTPGAAPRFSRSSSSSMSVNLLDIDTEDEEATAVSIHEAFAMMESGDWPICQGKTRNELTDPAHREAHDKVSTDRASGFEARLAQAELLHGVGCPSAAELFSWLPIYAEPGGSKGEHKASLIALRRIRDLGISDVDAVSRLLHYATNAANLKDGAKMLLKASEELDEWLLSLRPCGKCELQSSNCDCFNLLSSAIDCLLFDAADADLDVLLTAVLTDLAAPSKSLAATIVSAQSQLMKASPSTWAKVLEAVAARAEARGQADEARVLFARAYESGFASIRSHDRLSLLAERAGEYAFAAQVAEAALQLQYVSNSEAEKFRKRADRCRAKS